MFSKDFKDYSIKEITEKEVTSSGAKLEDVNLFLVLFLDRFASALLQRYGISIVILFNGMTSGGHKSFTHTRGVASDIAFTTNIDQVGIYAIWKLAIA